MLGAWLLADPLNVSTDSICSVKELDPRGWPAAVAVADGGDFITTAIVALLEGGMNLGRREVGRRRPNSGARSVSLTAS